MKKPNGFTLIELLVAVSILAILSTVGLVSFQSVRNRANDAKIRADLDSIKKAYEQNFDPSLNGGQGGYKALTDSMFSSGKIPTQSNGSSYLCLVGPDNNSTGYTCTNNPSNYTNANQGFQVSAVLSDNSTVAVKSTEGTLPVSNIASSTCSKFTVEQQQCKVWKGAVETAPGTLNPAIVNNTIYVNCSDLPSVMDCSLTTGGPWVLPANTGYYTSSVGGGNPADGNKPYTLKLSSQPNAIYRNNSVDPAQRSINIKLHLLD